ncbi:hypothetical protein LSM04_006811 [Trypanosoma melophagium]|uniref:uncharacterized protein n=1 Tax=Trypanosoma melophagium TaxID=715481 RepID=UPI00351A0B5A|nr:hypothetical protein LSM04_006811 [Trypanosoma melophagium]
MNTLDPVALQQPHMPNAVIQQRRSRNDDNSEVDGSHTFSVPPLPFLAISSTRAGESAVRHSTPPPIALLSRRQQEDPAILRLHAALARSSSSSMNRGTLMDISRPESPLTQTPCPAMSPKNSLSVGYDDDLMSSDFSTPMGASPSFYSRQKRNSTLSLQDSPTLLDSEEDNDMAQIVVPESYTVSDCPLAISYFPTVKRKNSRQQNEAHQQERQMVENTMTTDRFQISGTSPDPRFTLTQEYRNSTDINSIGTRGVSAMTSISVDVGVSVNKTEEEKDDTQSYLNDDDVIGVTAEGELIYQRDIASQNVNHDDNEEENEKASERYNQFSHQQHQGSLVYGGVKTPFYTPEKNVFTTALSRGLQQKEQEQQGRGDNSTTAMMMNPVITPSPVIPLWTRNNNNINNNISNINNINRGMNRRRKERVGPIWQKEDLEWCSLLLRYNSRENADECEYREVLTAVEELRKAQRRFPAEALELRLREEQEQEERYGKPPFILRW